MNNIGQLGLAFVLVFLIVAITTFALISPLTTVLDDVRSGNSTSLNCPGAPDFNQTLYDLDDTDDRLRKRPTCFITGMYMLYFVFAVLLFGIIWAYRKWRTT